MKCLVTGGAGFIGSNLTEELLRKGETVRILDNFATGKRENLTSFLNRIELLEGDIRSYHIVLEAVEGVDVIFHQAALPSVPRSIEDPITTNEVNVGGTLNILNAARTAGVNTIVYASSSSIYGEGQNLPIHEDTVPKPLSPYAVSKLAAEKYCIAFARLYKMNIICLRYFNIFGPRQDPTSQYSAVIPKFIYLLQQKKPPTIFGDGEQTRDFTYISNVVQANLLAAERESDFSGEIFNVAGGQGISVNELYRHLLSLFNYSLDPIYAPPREGEVKHSVADIGKICTEFGFETVCDFHSGLEKVVEWFNTHNS
jgi:nucleoside-diphosphate-sugar epimerase